MKLIQHITNFLNRVKYTEITYPVNSIVIDDDYRNLRELRIMIYKNVQDRPVVLIVYNMSTKVTIDLYLSMKPSFQLIIQSPMMLYSDDEVATVYNNDITTNSYMLHHITPHYNSVYDEALLVIDTMGIDKVIVLGPEEDKKGIITYISDLSDATDDVELVIDTMLNSEHKYVNFVESIDRACSFKNVIYYRLMDTLSFDDLSMGRKVDKEKIIMEALEYDPLFEKYFSKHELAVYSKRTKNLTISSSEKSKMFSNDLDLYSSLLFARSGKDYLLSYLAILFSNFENLRDMIDYPPPTDDLSFNQINRYRVIKLLKEEYGTGLMFYVAILLNTLIKLENVQGLAPEDIELSAEDTRYDLYGILVIRNINARLFTNIVSQIIQDLSQGYGDVISTRTKKIVVELMKIYSHREMKLINNDYYEDDRKYTLDTYYSVQDLHVKRDTINPLVVDEDKAVIYLWL